ncbi:hypothetical protein [Burkholderia diffusa]|uniref:hypothetical protein n=1 Tax=Burkholderia diffusa TaxID=488732 RepID=UPI000B18D356|nr:hypothetical protein [Burkholderia diffusa]
MERYGNYMKLERQRGFGLMGFVAGILAIMALAGVVYVATSSQGRLEVAIGQHDALASADRLLGQFAQAHGRYPCPAAQVNGTEDCSIKTKGWFPTSTLLPGTATFASWLPLKYVVYRGSGTKTDPDLAAVSDAYIPQLPDGTTVADYIGAHPDSVMLPAGADSAYPSILSNLDFCKKLAALRPSVDPWTALGNSASSPTSSRAYILPVSGTGITQVAYALAAAGGANGFGAGGFQGLNGDSSAGMQSPLAPIGASYGDQVLAVSVPSAARRMQCSQTLESVDMLATALSLEDDIQALKTAMLNALKIAIDLIYCMISEDTVFVAFRMNQTGIALIQVANAYFNAGEDAAAFNFPQMAIDLVSGGTISSLVQKTMNFIAAVEVVGTDVAYLAAYLDYQKKTQDGNVWHGGLPILEQADEVGSAFQIVMP